MSSIRRDADYYITDALNQHAADYSKAQADAEEPFFINLTKYGVTEDDCDQKKAQGFDSLGSFSRPALSRS